MTSNKGIEAIGIANKATQQSSNKTEQAQSDGCSKPLQQGILPRRVSTKERMTKAESNRRNALKSTGPKTLRGKRYSRSNALKHGLYSKELLVSEADRPEFEVMCVGLKAGLKPSTLLQELAFDYIVVCHWRCKLALRLEHQQLARQFQDEQPKNERGKSSDADAVIERWYGSSRADIRAGIGALEYAMAEFEGHGSFREETKKFLMDGFGPHFVRFLEEWNTMSVDAILMAAHLARHSKVFPDLPDTDVESSSPPGEMTKVVVDPMQGRHMVVKLLEERRNYLKEYLEMMWRRTFEGKRDASQSSDFNPRFLADANRELRRALDHYLDLKNKGL
jgi:hypothetical protein